MSAEEQEARYGDVVDELRVGALHIEIKHSCVRRDLYDMSLGRPFPPGLRALLAPLGVTRGTDVLFTIDVAGVHRLTVAAAAGRIVAMPKLATERPAQRQAALALAERVVTFVEGDAQSSVEGPSPK